MHSLRVALEKTRMNMSDLQGSVAKTLSLLQRNCCHAFLARKGQLTC